MLYCRGSCSFDPLLHLRFRPMSAEVLTYAGAVLFVAYLVRGIVGFGSGLIAIPLLTMVAPVTTVVPLVVLLDYLGSAGQSGRNRGDIAWREQVVLIPFMLLGVAGGLVVLNAVPATALARSLGVFVVAYAVYQLLPVPNLRASRAAASYCGLFGGLVGTLFGTGGPFYVIYFRLRALDKSAFRATFALNFLIDGGVRLVAYVAMGLLDWQTLRVLPGALPIAVSALWIGGRIHTGLGPEAFVRMISALLLASGITLLLKG